jgi:hypothetical protein
MIAICLVILPIAFCIHIAARRHLLLSTLAVPVAFSLMMLIGSAVFDSGNPTLRQESLRLTQFGSILALIVSILAALPVFAFKAYRRKSAAAQQSAE